MTMTRSRVKVYTVAMNHHAENLRTAAVGNPCAVMMREAADEIDRLAKPAEKVTKKKVAKKK